MSDKLKKTIYLSPDVKTIAQRRDDGACQACGIIDPTITALRALRHPPEGYTTADLVNVCADCRQGELDREIGLSGNANQLRVIYARRMKFYGA